MLQRTFKFSFDIRTYGDDGLHKINTDERLPFYFKNDYCEMSFKLFGVKVKTEQTILTTEKYVKVVVADYGELDTS